jgi:hypothetical protein
MSFQGINEDLIVELVDDCIQLDIGVGYVACIGSKEEADELIEFIKKHYDKLRDE